MDGNTSARLGLPYLAAGQLQKHVTLNEALTRLDALVQATVVSRTTAVQPGGPADGSLYILPDDATGADWVNRSPGDLVRTEAGGWTGVEAAEGLLAWVADEGQVVVRAGDGWVPLGERLKAIKGLERFGLNATADADNPFTARLNTALWTAVNAGDGGDGDLRLTLNKETAGDVLSLLFQSGYGGRAELGLIGDDDLKLKVSDDGATWRDVLTVDRTTGRATFSRGVVRIETQVIDADTTYVAPAWARRLEITAIGGGGGGAAGAVGTGAVHRFGGGGGGAGGVSVAIWSTQHLASSLNVVIGTGGAGGAGGASATGLAGSAGGSTTVASGGVTVLTAAGGGGGQGGSNGASGLGGAGGAASPAANKGADSLVGASPGVATSLSRPDGPGGGGGGGGIQLSHTVRPGGAGGDGGLFLMVAAGGAGGSAAVGGAGALSASAALNPAGGGGGGGGASVGTGHAGGVGVHGGGGGGGGVGTTASGSGGAGGAGVVRITAVG